MIKRRNDRRRQEAELSEEEPEPFAVLGQEPEQRENVEEIENNPALPSHAAVSEGVENIPDLKQSGTIENIIINVLRGNKEPPKATLLSQPTQAGPASEEKEREVKEIPSSKTIITANDVKAEIQTRIDKYKNIKTAYIEKLKKMVESGRITQEKSDILFNIFEKGYNDNEQKRINRLEKSLNDKDNIDRIVASSNLKLKQPLKRQGKEYEQELLNKKRLELKETYQSFLKLPQELRDRKNKNLDALILNDKHYQDVQFSNIDDINNFINDNKNEIDIAKSDKYQLFNLLSHLFVTTPNIPIIYDIHQGSYFVIAQQLFDYFQKKYVDILDSIEEKYVVVSGLIANLLEAIKLFHFESDDDMVKYSSFIYNFINAHAVYEEEEVSEDYKTDVVLIPQIVKLKEVLDKIDTKHITIDDKINVAIEWNKIFNSKSDFTMIWHYLGMEKGHEFGKTRGNRLWDRLFKDSPFYSKDHKLFAIEGLEALKDRANIVKNYDKLQTTFTKKNQELFSDKGETLSSAEAKKIFDKIIAALTKEDIDKLREQQSIVSKEKYKTGSGRKKKHGTLKKTILNILKS
jgi:hypothetical protein